MLTKDLIVCRLDGDFVRPSFIDTDDPHLLGLAEQLLAIHRTEPPPRRGEIAEAVGLLVKGQRNRRLGLGLAKLIDDRCEFGHEDRHDLPALRADLFRAGAELLRVGAAESPEDYRGNVLRRADLQDHPGLDAGLYADLPENEILVRFRALSPPQLLERYNVALVQSLLLRSDSLTVTVSSPEPAKMRRLFKYMRFFRLLGSLELRPRRGAARAEKGDAIRLTVDGPGSVLQQPKRYGLQIASFFPAICALENWLLDATVTWKKSTRRLRLTQASGLVSHYRNFGAYVPEEIRLFHRHFAEKVDDWKIVGHTPFLKSDGRKILFPDLSFEAQDGTLVHLELFHRWHRRELIDRLAKWQMVPDLPLILGVDRSLLSDDDVGTALDATPRFERHGFLFRDYPTVRRTLKCLKRAREDGINGATNA